MLFQSTQAGFGSIGIVLSEAGLRNQARRLVPVSSLQAERSTYVAVIIFNYARRGLEIVDALK